MTGSCGEGLSSGSSTVTSSGEWEWRSSSADAYSNSEGRHKRAMAEKMYDGALMMMRCDTL